MCEFRPRMRLAAGLCLDPLGELERSPRSHSRSWGVPTSKGKGRKGEGGTQKEKGCEEEGRGRTDCTHTFFRPCDKCDVHTHYNKKHLKNVGPISYCEPPLHCQSPGVASRTLAIAIAQAACDVHDNANDNAWQRGPLWPHGMGPINATVNEKMFTMI